MLTFIQPIDPFVLGWLALCILSALYVAYDQFRNNPEPTVMRWAFILTTLYMGPIGLLLYVMADKEPKPGTHEQFTRPLWKQGVGSTMHCVAGDATGIILSALIVISLGLPMKWDLVVEYLAGFMVGLFVFQALFMKSSMGGSYWENVKRSFLPELISMNFMMAGMAPVMVFLMMGRDMRAMQPTEPLFWAVMSLGVIAGFALAYPVNVWMVSRNMKHGLMTERPSGSRFDVPSQPLEPQNVNHLNRSQGKVVQAPQGHEAAGSASPAGHHMPEQDHAQMNHAEHAAHVQVTQAHAHMGHGTPPEQATASSPDHAAMGHEGHQMQPNVTRPQLLSVGLISGLLLLLGMTWPATKVNVNIAAHEVGSAIMPPGMIMTPDTPADAMKDMSAVDPRLFRFRAAVTQQGDQTLEPAVQGGVKRFNLTVSAGQWSILKDKTVGSYAINGQVPGPRLELEQGDQVEIVVKNDLPESTTLHWHGLILDNEMDGPAHITQKPIEPGGSYTYRFTAVQAGTYFYHSHDKVDRQQGLGVYGALIIRPTSDPVKIARVRGLILPDDDATAIESPAANRADLEYVIQLQEWLSRDGLTYPAMNMEGGLPNYFTINGKAYPNTQTIRMRVGQTVKVRFIGSNNNFVHPMHIHGGPFNVVARDGETLPAAQQFLADTVNVGPGQRYDVIWRARKPGTWLIHCHIPHHTTNNNTEQDGGGGLMMKIVVEG